MGYPLDQKDGQEGHGNAASKSTCPSPKGTLRNTPDPRVLQVDPDDVPASRQELLGHVFFLAVRLPMSGLSRPRLPSQAGKPLLALIDGDLDELVSRGGVSASRGRR